LLLATIGVKVLIIDEIQQRVAAAHRGFGHARRLQRDSDRPATGQSIEPTVLHRWTMSEDYLRLLASFEKVIPLEHRSELLQPAMAIKILSLSEGTIGEISAPICRAAIAAIVLICPCLAGRQALVKKRPPERIFHPKLLAFVRRRRVAKHLFLAAGAFASNRYKV
jgi:hypothetical protein